jgi:hypothetical protein
MKIFQSIFELRQRSLGNNIMTAQVVSKPKPRAVLKRKPTEEHPETGGKQLKDADHFGMSYAN